MTALSSSASPSPFINHFLPTDPAAIVHLLSQRTLPCVILSCGPDGQTSCDVPKLVRVLNGRASVHIVPTKTVSWLLSQQAPEFAAWNGAIRICGTPRRGLDVYVHVMTSNRMAGADPDRVLDMVMERVEHCLRWEGETAIAKVFPQGIMSQLEFLELEGNTHRRMHVEPELANDSEEDEGPGTVLEVLEEVAEKCPHLLFAPSAFDSAERCPFRKPRKLRHALLVMEEAAAEWRRGGGTIRGGWKPFFRERGLDYKSSVSDTTLGHYGADYRFPYLGSMVKCLEHLTLGVSMSADKCMSVHWYADFEHLLFHVPHVGRHLRNFSSN